MIGWGIELEIWTICQVCRNFRHSKGYQDGALFLRAAIVVDDFPEIDGLVSEDFVAFDGEDVCKDEDQYDGEDSSTDTTEIGLTSSSKSSWGFEIIEECNSPPP